MFVIRFLSQKCITLLSKYPMCRVPISVIIYYSKFNFTYLRILSVSYLDNTIVLKTFHCFE